MASCVPFKARSVPNEVPRAARILSFNSLLNVQAGTTVFCSVAATAFRTVALFENLCVQFRARKFSCAGRYAQGRVALCAGGVIPLSWLAPSTLDIFNQFFSWSLNAMLGPQMP